MTFFLFEFLCYITFKNFLVCTHNLQLYDCGQSQQFHSVLFHAINDYILFHQADVHNSCSFLPIVEFLNCFLALDILDNVLVNMFVPMAFSTIILYDKVPRAELLG